MTKHIVVNILNRISLSLPCGLPCEFRIKNRLTWIRPVFVRINPFHCVKQEWHWHPINTAVGLGAQHCKIWFQLWDKLQIQIMKKEPALLLYSKLAIPQERLKDAFRAARVMCPRQYAAMTKKATTLTDNVRDVHKLPFHMTTSTYVISVHDCSDVTGWVGNSFARTSVHAYCPQHVSFLLVLKKPFNSCQLMKYYKDMYI